MFGPAGHDPARAGLEAIALKGCRRDRHTEYDVRELLGFETRMEVDGFLKEHGAFLHTRSKTSNMISMPSPKASERTVVNSRPPKSAPSTTTRVLMAAGYQFSEEPALDSRCVRRLRMY